MKTKSNKAPPQQNEKQILSKVHRDRSRIVKGEQKNLHILAADAFDRASKSSEKISDIVVRVNLDTLSKGILEREDELRKRESRCEEIEKILWEGRYCDYLAKALAKVRSSTKWQTGADNHKGDNWIKIKSALGKETENGKLHQVLRDVAEELRFPTRAIITWINIYASRCASDAHHGNLETVLKDGDVDAGRNQIWSDRDDIFTSIPSEYSKHASDVLIAIIDYQNKIFVSCPKKGKWELTDQGKKLTGK